MLDITRTFKAATLVAALLVCAAAVGQPPVARADKKVTVAWTTIGIYPQSAPSMGSGQQGAALPDGATVSVVCEQKGQPVGNGDKVRDVGDRLDNGAWLPNAFLKTEADGWTPGVPHCSDLAPKNKPEMVDRAANPDEVQHAVSSPCGSYIAHTEWTQNRRTLSVTPTDCGRLTAFVNHQASFDELYHLVKANWSDDLYWSMHNQWTCHADWAPPYLKSEWNLDLGRPNVGYWTTVRALCNP